MDADPDQIWEVWAGRGLSIIEQNGWERVGIFPFPVTNSMTENPSIPHTDEDLKVCLEQAFTIFSCVQAKFQNEASRMFWFETDKWSKNLARMPGVPQVV